MAKKTPNSIDRHVGSRLRMRRVLMGMSQEKLGDQLGVTFQQVQKYEKGMNRIGASRLQHASRALEVPIEFFFRDAPQFGAEFVGFYWARSRQTAISSPNSCRRTRASSSTKPSRASGIASFAGASSNW